MEENIETGKVLPEPVVMLREKVAAWRENKQNRYMPKELWREAVLLAGKYGVHPVSKNAGVSYNQLKKLVDGGQKKSSRKTSAFVDVSNSGMLSGFGKCAKIHMSRSDGSKVVFHETDSVCVSKIAEAFFVKNR